MNMLCVACGSSSLKYKGELPAFLEDNLDGALGRSMEPGKLYECRDCTLQLRTPLPCQNLLNDYYRRLKADQAWDNSNGRIELEYIKFLLEQCSYNSILDVGCFRGDLLEYLDPTWERFGIEMSQAASAAAESKGIKIIADSLESLEAEGRFFDVITMIDVIEHLRDPVGALKKLIGRLASRGMLLISTGNTDSISFRVSGANYYYRAYPEHITFYSPRWFEWIAPNLDCRSQLMLKFSHNPAGVMQRLDETVKNYSFIGYHHLNSKVYFRRVLPLIPGINRIAGWGNCWWTSAKDHMLLSLAKD